MELKKSKKGQNIHDNFDQGDFTIEERTEEEVFLNNLTNAIAMIAEDLAKKELKGMIN